MAYGIQTELDSLIKLKHAAAMCLQNSRVATRTSISHHLTHFSGRGIDFNEVRYYQPGDDARRIHWRVTARTGQPHTKLYLEEKAQPVLILVDQSRSLFFGSKQTLKSVLAAEIAAVLAWKTVLKQDQLIAMIFEDCQTHFFKNRVQHHTVLALLKKLSAIQAVLPRSKNQRYFREALAQAARLSRPRTHIYLISDFLDLPASTLPYLTRLSKRSRLSICWVRDHFERMPLPAGNFSLCDGDRTLQIDLRQSDTRKQMQVMLDRNDQYLKESFLKNQIAFYEFFTDQCPLTNTRFLHDA